MTVRMWMIRSEGGSLYDTFREQSMIGIGWQALAAHAIKPDTTRDQLINLYQAAEPGAKRASIVAGASQIWRFINDMHVGDEVLTYSPLNRLYLLGTIDSSPEHRPEWGEQGMSLVRKVQWQTQELPRDKLSTKAKNGLGSIATLFVVASDVATEIRTILAGQPALGDEDEENIDIGADPLTDLESQAIERIKDKVNELSWDEMQQLVAGILRAMGYKTQISPPGADRGKDIIASPDGFGFEHPRIVVEVKHRCAKIGREGISSFLGGRHKDDRGLYISTGGFSKEAHYEADRGHIPLTLWTLDHVVRTLLEYYQSVDAQTRHLVPLNHLYWPA